MWWKLIKNKTSFKRPISRFLSLNYSTKASNAFADQLKERQERIFKNLQETEQILNVPLNRFLTTNVVKSEYDILNFALKKSDLLEEILCKTGYSGLNIIDKLFQHTNNYENNSLGDLKLYSKYSEFTLGGIILALLAKCLQTVPYYKQDDDFKLKIGEDQTKFARQISFAESFEMLDKAIYIHQYAVMNFPLNKLNELNDSDKSIDLYNSLNSNKSNKSTSKTGTKVSNIKLNFESMNKRQKAICNEINNCNKLSILSGDYLFSFSIINIANRVNKSNAFDFVGAAIDDYIMNQFKTETEINESIDFYDQYNLPTEKVSLSDYEINSGHGANGLLAFSAQYIAKLSDLTSIQFEKFCFDLGWNLRIKWNIEQDLKWLYNSKDQSLRLYSLPLVLYIQKHPEFVTKIRNGFNTKTIDVNELKKTLLNEEILNECIKLQAKHSKLAIDSIKILPKNEATQNLRNLIK